MADDTPIPESTASDSTDGEPHGPPPPGPWRFQFGIASLLLLMTLCAVVLAAFQMQPGVGIALAILSVPAAIRAAVVATRKRVAGQPLSIPAKIWVFTATLGLLTVIVVATGAAFVGTCFPIGAWAFDTNISGLMFLAWIVGIAVGLGVLALLLWLFRRVWPR